MKVKELIAELQKHDPELEVKILSCEESYMTEPPAIQDAKKVEVNTLYLVDTTWYDKQDALDCLAAETWQINFYDHLEDDEKIGIDNQLSNCETLEAVFIKGDI